MTKTEKKNLPQTAGFYWSANAGQERCDAIVEVYGDFPFFKVRGWDFFKEREIDDVAQLSYFGDKIKEHGKEGDA